MLTFLLGVASGMVWLTGVVGRTTDAIGNEVVVELRRIKEEDCYVDHSQGEDEGDEPVFL